jgi:PEP-CTERM motif-containing protein
MANAVNVTANSTIDVTGAPGGAITGQLSIGSNTLFITGGSTGADTPYFLSLGATTLSGNPTFDVANNGTGTGTLRLASINTGGAARTITKANAGTLEIQGASVLTSGSAIHANVGTLRFNNTSGAATIGTGVTATVAAGATLELAGSVSNLSSPSPAGARVNIVNSSTQLSGGSLSVTGTHQQVGSISGAGDTIVATGADLTANSIIQGALVIGGSSTQSATVTIAASDSAGNPLAATGGLALTDSLGAGAPLSSNSLTGGAPASNFGSLGLGGGLGAATAAVPEPSTLVLLAIGTLAGSLAVSRRRHLKSRG